MRRIALLTVLATLVPAGAAGASFVQDVGSPLTVQSASYSVGAADFDANGRPDLVIPNGDDPAGSVSVYLRSTSGTWTQAPGSPYLQPEPGADDVAIADFDGDGRPDFAVASYSTSNGGAVLLRNADNSGFHQEGTTMPVPNAATVAAGDLNGDHKPDLVFGSTGTSNLYFALRKSGNNGFEDLVTLASPGVKQSVAIGDFSGDGRPDIVSTNQNVSSIDLWVQNASPTVGFTHAGPFPVDGHPYGLAVADFNRDGHLDIAAALFDVDKVQVLLGHSNKTFTKEAGQPANDGPIGVETGDFNGDGAPDVAVANQAGKRVTVLLRTATGFVPDPSSPIVTNLAATGLAIADFNVDGRPDIAAANIGASFVSVLLNSTPPPPPPPPPDLDKDDDGVQTPLDCDDGNPLIKPGAFDVPGDGINQDCSADGDADYPLPGVKIKYSVLTYPAGYSKFAKLTLAPVKAGDKVVLKCKGRGCKFKKKTFNVKQNKPRLSLLKPLKRAKLRKGAAVTMRMTRAGTYGSYARWKIRATDSKFKSLCLRPGDTTPIKCPST
jgi:hypothetical protein